MQSPKGRCFEDNVKCFPDSLATVLGSHHRTGIQNELKARATNNRYYLIARDLSYTDYMKIKGFLYLN
jgi:cell division protein FtsI (penicillin-binding protein 3)